MLVTQSCPALCDPMDCSPPGSSVHEVFQARILEWVAVSFSKEKVIFMSDTAKQGSNTPTQEAGFYCSRLTLVAWLCTLAGRLASFLSLSTESLHPECKLGPCDGANMAIFFFSKKSTFLTY